MTTASEIQRIQNNIAATYTAASNKGATLPATENSDNLATCISSISSGSSAIIIPMTDVDITDNTGWGLYWSDFNNYQLEIYPLSIGRDFCTAAIADPLSQLVVSLISGQVKSASGFSCYAGDSHYTSSSEFRVCFTFYDGNEPGEFSQVWMQPKSSS